MFGIAHLSSFSAQPLLDQQRREARVVGQDDDVAVDRLALRERAWIFPKHVALSLMSSM